MKSCPQCTGAIDPLCVRVSPARRTATHIPQRYADGWCDHCLTGWRAMLQLSDGNWVITSVIRLPGDTARSIRTYAESQINVIRENS